MIGIICPDCRGDVHEVESKNLFTRHGACIRCDAVFTLWGRCVTKCQTPWLCTGKHLRYLHYTIPSRPVIIPGPRGMGML